MGRMLKRTGKQLTGLLAAMCIAISPAVNAPFSVTASAAESTYADGNRMSDEEFFGKWDAEENTWEMEPKLNYQYDDGLSLAEDYIKSGDYGMAKEIILNYYKKRSDLKYPVSLTRNTVVANALKNWIIPCETTLYGIYSISEQPQWYEFDVSDAVKLGQYNFGFQSMERDLVPDGEEEIVRFHSKEAEENKPELVVQTTSGTVTLTPEADMYLRGGAYSKVPYGGEEEVLISEDGSDVIGNGTRQGYFRFDFSELDLEQVTGATLRLYGSSSQEGKRVLLFQGRELTWSENTACTDNTNRRLFSYQYLECPWALYAEDWHAGVYTQYSTVMRRLYHLTYLFAETEATGDSSYAQVGVDMLLDFIKKNGGIYWGENDEVLTSGFRAGGGLLSYVFSALNSDVCDATAFGSILKFIWQEAYWHCQAENESRNSNITSAQNILILECCVYFPEFAQNPTWVKVAGERYWHMAEDLVFEDGAYCEGTSGYDMMVFGQMLDILEKANIGGIELPDLFEERLRSFALAQIAMSQPGGAQFQWGDGGAGGSAGVKANIKRAAELLDDDTLLYFATDGVEGKVMDFTSRFLPKGRLAAMRDNWSDNGVVGFLIANDARNHGHNYSNGMSLYAYGRLMFGNYRVLSYDVGQGWNYYLMYRQRAHNTIEMNGLGSMRTGLQSASMVSNDRMDHFSGVTDSYLQVFNRTHTRKVTFIKNNKKFFVVTDFIDANGSDDTVNYDQPWTPLADANVTMNPVSKVAKTNFGVGANVEFAPVAPEELTKALIDDGYSENSYGDKMEAKMVSYQKETAGNAKLCTLIYPFEGKADYEIQTQSIPVVGDTEEKAAAFTANLPDDSRMVYYVNDESGVRKSFGEYDATADMFYLERNASGKLKFISAAGVSSVTKNGENYLDFSRRLSDLSVEYPASAVKISTSDSINLAQDYIMIPAAESSRILLNGEEVTSYAIVDGCIVIGNYSHKISDAIMEASVLSVQADKDLVLEYPLTRCAAAKSAVLQISSGTVLAGDSSAWDGKLPICAAEESVSGKKYTLSVTLPKIEASQPIRLEVQGSGWQLRKDGADMTCTEISRDDPAAAEGAVGESTAAIYTGGGSTVFYFSGLGQLELSSGNGQSTEKPSGGSGSGGNPSHVQTGGGTSTGVVTPPVTTPKPPEDKTPMFDDIEGHWAESVIVGAVEKGYVKGYEDGGFHPDEAITRGELAVLAGRVLGLEQDAPSRFADVPENAWYAGAVNALAEAGILSGDGVNYEPQRLMTRSELAKVFAGMCRYLGIAEPEEKAADFTDAETFAPWESEAIASASTLGLIHGMPDGSFRNKASATRAETVQILTRLLTLVGDMEQGE